jgi:cyclase
MLRPRIIPCLLIHKKGLVKTVKFKTPKYVGDPLNAVRIFNEKEADELMVLDIDATVENREPDYKLIEHLAHECRMPLCYGGGIKSVAQAQRVFSLGVEKIALSSAVINDPSLVTQIAEQVGVQSVVVVLDVKKQMLGKYVNYIWNGKKKTNINLTTFIGQLQKLGIGEIVFNSIDQDGTMNGYDLDFIEKIKPLVKVPLTVLGGAGTLDHIEKLIRAHGIIGAAAGSIFVFKGKYRAVLINYPNQNDKKKMSKDRALT